MQNVVIVESPAKAKTIGKYLGKDFSVLASFGHVRDLPSKDGSVRPDEDFAMTYEVDADSKKHLATIAKAVKASDALYLASDPDREGEAISWHILEALKEKKALKKSTQVYRIAFNEITKQAVQEALKHPRDINMDLVNSQQARRALDYLVGFTLSPVLWRKLPGSRSAGRVQSVALRLICERDEEIENFESEEYWDIHSIFTTASGTEFKAKLIEWQNEKLKKFSITKEQDAKQIAEMLGQKEYNVAEIEPKQSRRNPPPPFITSTLQQEASRKLGFGAKQTMQVAQKLYEGVEVDGQTTGLITYMRTDGVTVAQEALQATRKQIGKHYGDNYVPEKPRFYKSKVKNAQEAHEAIRPTNILLTPSSIKSALNEEQYRLYDLIWKRMVASQMASAIIDQVGANITSKDKDAVLRATGSVIKFDGFLKLYEEGKDEEGEEESKKLPPMELGENVDSKEILPAQHFTEPPPRYSEASLVKKLEELGIGRPSTYASIISILLDRGYVKLDRKRFVAESRGRIVSAFLVSFFDRYVEYDFTAKLEERLDAVSAGETEWKELLGSWWSSFIMYIDAAKELPPQKVLEEVDRALEKYVFGTTEGSSASRECQKCEDGKLSLKTGKYGAFIGCSNYPECSYTKQLATAEEDENGTAEGAQDDGPKLLGTHPDSGEEIVLKKGPYGFYVQQGEGKKPKRSSLPKHIAPDTVTMEIALGLLSLPRTIGKHPESGQEVKAGLGRFGPYLLHDGKYTSLPAEDDLLTIGINRAVTVIAEKASKGRKKAEPLRVLGKHPDDEKEVALYDGRYGPYVKHGRTNASLKKGTDPDTITIEQAIELLEKKKKAPKKPAKRKKA